MIHSLIVLAALACSYVGAGTRVEPANYGTWLKIAACESGSRWHLSNPPYSGGVEFLDSTWTSMDTQHYAPTAGQATEREQMLVADHLLRVAGWQSWPVCSIKVGAR